MSTPAAIRFLDQRTKTPFSGLYLHYDASLDRLIEDLLAINQKIVWFPIHLLSSEDRIQARHQAGKVKGLAPEHLRFVTRIEDYALFFTAMYFNRMDVYDAHYSKVEFEGLESGSTDNEAEQFSAVENELSMLRLDSGYLNNVVYLVDIEFPDVEQLTLKNEPVLTISTGTGEGVFKGTFAYLNASKEALLAQP